jgi:hypothetical protein
MESEDILTCSYKTLDIRLCPDKVEGTVQIRALFFGTYFNTVLPSVPRSPKWFCLQPKALYMLPYLLQGSPPSRLS